MKKRTRPHPPSVLIRATARLLIVALAPLTFDGCVSTEVVRLARTTSETATLEAKVFESVSDSHKDVLSQRTLAWKFYDDRQSVTVPVREGTGNAWSASASPASPSPSSRSTTASNTCSTTSRRRDSTGRLRPLLRVTPRQRIA
ncbi:MAG: hypothetical protein ACHQPI_05600 [Thermoanaerobaculia bacterium]